MGLERLLHGLRELHQRVLVDRLTGCYIHGSLALGAFQWNRSDVDLLAVVREEPTLPQKMALISGLLELESAAPPKGLETSVLCQSVCKPFVYPTPYVLHYSPMHRERAQRDLSGYCQAMHGLDRDLAAHVAVTRQAGIVLCGAPVEEAFDSVPRWCYLDSVLADIGPDAALDRDPAYTLLNLCRTWAYLAGEGILSKRRGGEWALPRLSPGEAACVQAALISLTDNQPPFPCRQALEACATSLLQRVRNLTPDISHPRR